MKRSKTSHLQNRQRKIEELEDRRLLVVEPFPILKPVQPMGGLIHSEFVVGQLATISEIDSYQLNADAAQTLALMFEPENASLIVRVTLLDPTGNALASRTSTVAGETLRIPATSTASGGNFRFDVTSISGIGNYKLSAYLNSDLEIESGSGGNDVRSSAQSLGTSAVSVGSSVDRLAVRGYGEGIDYYSLSLTAGVATDMVIVSEGAAPAFVLENSAGQAMARSVADGSASRQWIPNVITTGGPHYLRVEGAGNVAYNLLVIRGGSLEHEPNDTSVNANRLSSATNGLGRIDGVLVDSFESGAFGSEWTRYSSQAQGRIRITGQLGVADGSLAMYMDRSPSGAFNLNEAIWTVDTRNASTATLRFSHAEWGDEEHAFNGPFDQHFNADGVAFSVDGNRWYPLWSAANQNAGLWQSYSFDLLAAASAVGVNLSRSVQIKFQQYDDFPMTTDGRAWDNIRLEMDREDRFRITANAGDVLQVRTSTPGDGSGEPLNDLDPIVELYDPAGNLVASNNNGAADGRNALLTYPVTAQGDYQLRLASVTGRGDYLLQTTGSTFDARPKLSASLASIVNGSTITTFPDYVRLAFSSTLLLTSISANDLTINGTPASDVRVIDGQTVEFVIASTKSGDGSYLLRLAPGVMSNVAGVANDDFALTFTLDATSPTVVATNLAAGAVLSPGSPWLFTATFSEPLNSIGLGPEDVFLVEQRYGTQYTATNVAYNPATFQLAVTFPALRDGDYELRLVSGSNSFRDLVGLALNGGPSFPLPSGQGNPAADDFVVPFTVDITGASAYPGPLLPKLPLGSLIYDPSVLGPGVLGSSVLGSVYQNGDVDAYTISIDAGQKLTLIIQPTAGLQPEVNVYGPASSEVRQAESIPS